MVWNKVKVTAKRLHRDQRPGAHVDMLINEHDFVSCVLLFSADIYYAKSSIETHGTGTLLSYNWKEAIRLATPR